MKTNKKEKLKFEIELNPKWFTTGKRPIKKLRLSAKKVVKDLMDDHFNPKKKMGWDLNYSMIVDDVFYEAFGHNLETYLLAELPVGFAIKTSEKNGDLVLSKIKTKRKKK